jgi:hypothetical protein
MDGWSPHFTITAIVFGAYVLLAVFGSREPGPDGRGESRWRRLRRIARFRRHP